MKKDLYNDLVDISKDTYKEIEVNDLINEDTLEKEYDYFGQPYSLFIINFNNLETHLQIDISICNFILIVLIFVHNFLITIRHKFLHIVSI